MTQRSRIRRFFAWIRRHPVATLYLIGLGLIVVSMPMRLGGHFGVEQHLAYTGIGIILGVSLCYFFLLLGAEFYVSYKRATVAVPDLLSIKTQLEAQGYTNLTLADLEAVHRYLSRQRNEARGELAVMAGLVYLGGRKLR